MSYNVHVTKSNMCKINRKLSLYPKGTKAGKNTNLSIFLRPHDVGSDSDEWRVYAKFNIRLKTHGTEGTHKNEGIA